MPADRARARAHVPPALRSLGSRLARSARTSRIRLRLTALYGGLFVVSGAILLAITYLLVSGSPTNRFIVHRGGPGASPTDGAQVGDRPPGRLDPVARELRDQAVRQHQAELHHLLVQSALALALMVVISLVLGWLVAGRVLRPLRTMTASIRQISATNVHERLAAIGPADELRNLSDTVDGLLGRLETALDAQRRFVANAAHELRTPLTLQHALLEESLLDPDADLDAMRTTFSRLLALGDDQARLLDSLLTLAGSERGLDRTEPVDLAGTAETVATDRLAAAGRDDLELTTALRPARLLGDPALVERLVANLVDNALTYNRPDGRVEVTTTTNGRALLRVANTGPHVPPDGVDRLFEPFQRLDRTAAQEEHHGLGLSIVRAIVVAHGATVAAHARPEGGLVVEVAFPAVPDTTGHRDAAPDGDR